ncbi:MAG: SusC/RagA family TonB-linked outer membrane protein [Rikenellaceae bacterium]
MKITDNIKVTLLSALVLSSSVVSADEISGVVRDIQNRPLSGYVVTSIESQNEAITNKRGEFSIEAQMGERVDISIDGVSIDTATLSDDNEGVINIAPDPYKLKIESAANTRIDRHRTSAAIDVATSEDLENYSGYSSTNTIIGKLASLTTVLSSGVTNSDYAALYVRGMATTTGSTALVLVDGYESDLSRLNNIEIESITVLKDAVALAPYGLRGANGVVLVTTKSGIEGKPQFKVNVEYGVSQLQKRDYVGAAEYSTLVNEARANDGLSAIYSDEELAAQGTDQYLYPDMDWVSEMMKSMSKYTQASIEMTGGSSTIRYYTMFDYKTYDGAFNHTDYNDYVNQQNDMTRLNFRSNVSMDVTKSLQLNARLGGRISNSSDLLYGSNAYYNLLCSTPANRYSIFNEDGSYNGDAKNVINPYAHLVERGVYDYHERAFDASVDLNYSLDFITKGLSASAAISFASEALVTEAYSGGTYAVYEPATAWVLNEEGTKYVETPSYNEYGNDAEVAFDPASSSQDETVTQSRTNTMRFAFNYDREFGKHSVVSSFVAERAEQNYQNYAEAFKYINFALSANYGYNDKYFADLVISCAGSNAYEKGKMGLFPAVGASWIASNEDFLKSSSTIDFLKVRASAGITGGSPTDSRFLYLYTYGSDGTYYFGETATSSTGLSQSALMDPDFSWERGYSYNAGFDTRMLSNRLSLSVDAFAEKRVNILDSYDDIVTSMAVWSNMYDCYAQVLNKGVDFTLGFQDSYKSGLSFSVSANGGFSKNKILQQYEIENDATSVVGYPVNAIFGYATDGFYSSDEEAAVANTTFGSVQAGDIKYVDQDNNGVIDEYDQTYLGSSFPTFRYGLNLNVSYKGVYVDAWFDGQAGAVKNVSSNVIFNPLNGADGNISQYAADNCWTAERGDSAELPRLSYDYNENNSQTNSLYMMNSNFMRLRTAEVGYNLPNKLLKRLGLGSTKIYLRGHNLFVVDATDGAVDPEVTSGYPIAKSVYVGLNVGF